MLNELRWQIFRYSRFHIIKRTLLSLPIGRTKEVLATYILATIPTYRADRGEASPVGYN